MITKNVSIVESDYFSMLGNYPQAFGSDFKNKVQEEFNIYVDSNKSTLPRDFYRLQAFYFDHRKEVDALKADDPTLRIFFERLKGLVGNHPAKSAMLGVNSRSFTIFVHVNYGKDQKRSAQSLGRPREKLSKKNKNKNKNKEAMSLAKIFAQKLQTATFEELVELNDCQEVRTELRRRVDTLSLKEIQAAMEKLEK